MSRHSQTPSTFARQLMQARPAVEILFGDLTLELRTETAMPSHAPSSDKPIARSNSYLPVCPVLGVHSRSKQSRVTFQLALTALRRAAGVVLPGASDAGAELLAAGKAAQAEKVYHADLRINPGNPRSLYGLAMSLKAQGRIKEATQVKQQFAKSWAYADKQASPMSMAAISDPQ